MKTRKEIFACLFDDTICSKWILQNLFIWLWLKNFGQFLETYFHILRSFKTTLITFCCYLPKINHWKNTSKIFKNMSQNYLFYTVINYMQTMRCPRWGDTISKWILQNLLLWFWFNFRMNSTIIFSNHACLRTTVQVKINFITKRLIHNKIFCIQSRVITKE